MTQQPPPGRRPRPAAPPAADSRAAPPAPRRPVPALRLHGVGTAGLHGSLEGSPLRQSATRPPAGPPSLAPRPRRR